MHTFPLPGPPRDAGIGEAFGRRRSVRRFDAGALRPDDLSTLLWAGYGRRDDGGRTVPSAHGVYGLGLTVVAGNVEDLPPGVYGYDADRHALRALRSGDHRVPFAAASLADAEWLPDAAAFVLVSGDIDATNAHFADQPPLGRRGERYVWLEVGHVSQNVYLAAAGRGLGAVLVGGVDDERLRATAAGLLPSGHEPLVLLAVGPEGNGRWRRRW